MSEKNNKPVRTITVNGVQHDIEDVEAVAAEQARAQGAEALLGEELGRLQEEITDSVQAAFNSGYIYTADKAVGGVLSLTAQPGDTLSHVIVDVSGYDYAMITAEGSSLYYTYVFLDANNTIISYNVSDSLTDEKVLIPEGAVTLVVNNKNLAIENPSVKIVSTISSRLDNIAQQIAAVEDEVETLNDALNDAVNVKIEAEFAYGFIYTQNIAVGDTLKITVSTSDTIKCAILDVAGYDNVMFSGRGSALAYTYLLLDENNIVLGFNANDTLVDYTIDLTSLETHPAKIIVQAVLSQFSNPKLIAYSSVSSSIEELHKEIVGKQDTLVSGTNIKTINGQSLLGEGDITIEGGGSVSDDSELDVTFNSGYINTENMAEGDVLQLTVRPYDTLSHVIVDVSGYAYARITAEGSRLYYTYVFLDANNTIISYDVSGSLTDEKVMIPEGAVTLVVNNKNLAIENPSVKIVSTINLDKIAQQIAAVEDEVETLNDTLNDAVNVKTEAEFAYGYIYTENIAVGDKLTITVSTSGSIKYAILDVAGYDNVMFSGRGSALLYTYLLLDENNIVLGFNASDTLVDCTIDLTSLETHPTKIIVQALLSIVDKPKLVAYSSISSSIEAINDTLVEIEDRISTSGSVIQGKKIVVFGDSLMEGTNEQEGKTVSQYIEELSGAIVYNAGIGGTAYRRRWLPAFNDYTVEIFDETTAESGNYEYVKDYAYSFLDLSVLVPAWASGDLTNCLKAAQWLADIASDDNTPQIKSLQSIAIADADIVIMAAGANDFPYSNVEMVGDTTDINTADRSTNTVLGGLNLCIKSLLGAGSRLSLFVFTPICRYFGTRGEGDMAEWFDESLWSDNYTPVFATSVGVNYRDGVDMIIETARAAGVPVCDAYRGLGWNRYNYWNYLSSTNLTDGVHAKRGYDKMAVLYYNFITSGTTAAGKGEGGDITVDGALSETSTNPVQNKVVTAEIAAAIEEGRKQALHALFESAGAKYNETTGTYTLNEVEGITEEEMSLIYNAPHNMFVAAAYTPFTRDEYKTFLFYGNGTGTPLTVSLNKLFYGTKIQKIKFAQPLQTWVGALYCPGSDLSAMFGLCKVLTHILGTMYVEDCTLTNMFLQCYELQEFDMRYINKPLSLSACSKLTKETLVGIINNSKATSAITIILHADVYAKCVEDGEWYTEVSTALSSKEFVSIVSA